MTWIQKSVVNKLNWVFILRICVNVCVSPSVCLPVYVFSRYENWVSRCCSSSLLTGFSVNHLFSVLYASCLDIHKAVSVIWFHYINHVFSHQCFQNFFILLKLILSATRLHNTENSLNKTGVIYERSYLLSIFVLVIICDGIPNRSIINASSLLQTLWQLLTWSCEFHFEW